MKRIDVPKKLFVLALALLSLQAIGADGYKQSSAESRNLADWVVETKDNQGLPFIIIDKKQAKVFVFMTDGKIIGESSALIGTTIGDDTSNGVGKKKLSEITIDERTTPAGRFNASLGLNLNHSELLWIDYESGLSMHTVITSNRDEHRLQRLLNPDPKERRITYGCINIPARFYRDVIHPTFTKSHGIVYILPEVHSILNIFGPDADLYSRRNSP